MLLRGEAMLCLGTVVVVFMVYVGFEVYEVAALYHSCERSAI